MPPSRRGTALELAADLLTDIELSRIPAPEILKKTSRLARLLDDTDAIEWLNYEVHGYPEDGLDGASTRAAIRSGRRASAVDLDEDAKDKGEARYWTSRIDRLQATYDAGMARISAAVDAPVSLTSANPYQVVAPPPGNAHERGVVSQNVVKMRDVIGAIVAALHAYVAEKEIELRFGQVVEGAFETVRNTVDAKIASLVPDAAVKLAAAFENAASDNPEHWANAASTCRRLLKAVADALRPPSEPVNGRAMTDDKYINRLIDWIATQRATGATRKDVVASDLEDFGKRIDAFDDAGHKGAHAELTKYDASRFITGVYLLIGDILQIRDAEGEPAVEDQD